jgi:hypothetical protein
MTDKEMNPSTKGYVSPKDSNLQRFKPFCISNALVDDFVVNHKSTSPSSLKTAHYVMVPAKAGTESVSNEKRCKKELDE